MGRVRLYAIVRSARGSRALPRGLEGEELRLLKRRKLSLIIGDACERVEPTRTNLIAYDRLIGRLAASNAAILPARFDVVAESSRVLTGEIDDRAEVLGRALALVEGRVQMTVRRTRRRELPKLAAEAVTRPSASGRQYLAGRAADLASASLLAPAVRARLVHVVRAERLTATATGVVIYHLIDTRDVRKYRGILKTNVSGPFPPYAFVPGIDHALWLDHEGQEKRSSDSRSTRSRTDRRSS